MASSRQTVSLLPLLLKPGKKQEFQVIITGCRRLELGELVYRNTRQPDLIKSCSIHINGQTVSYQKSSEFPKTYYVNGQKNATAEIEIDPSEDVNVTLNVSCKDFNVCHCKEHRFQLKLSALF